jgi:hypothetical protein
VSVELLRDSFDRADSTTSLGTTTTGGQTWTPVGTTVWGIMSGEGYCVSDTDGNITTVGIPTNPLDYSVSYSMRGAVSTGNTRRLVLLVRYVSNRNFFLISFVAGNITLVKVDTDVFTSVQVIPFTSLDNTYYRLKAVCSGKNIKVYVDGVLKIDYLMSDTDYTKFGTVTTRAGLRLNKSNAPIYDSRVDDFVVETIDTGTVQTTSGQSDGATSATASPIAISQSVTSANGITNISAIPIVKKITTASVGGLANVGANIISVSGVVGSSSGVSSQSAITKSVLFANASSSGVSSPSSSPKITMPIAGTSSGTSQSSSAVTLLFSAAIESDGSSTASSNVKTVQFASGISVGASSDSAQVYRQFTVQTSSDGVSTVSGSPTYASSVGSSGISNISGIAIITSYANGESDGSSSSVSAVIKKQISAGQSDALTSLSGTPIAIKTESVNSVGEAFISSDPSVIRSATGSSNGYAMIQSSIQLTTNFSAAADGKATVDIGDISTLIGIILAQSDGIGYAQGNAVTGKAIVDIIKLNGKIAIQITLDAKIESGNKLVAVVETDEKLTGIIG